MRVCFSVGGGGHRDRPGAPPLFDRHHRRRYEEEEKLSPECRRSVTSDHLSSGCVQKLFAMFDFTSTHSIRPWEQQFKEFCSSCPGNYCATLANLID